MMSFRGKASWAEMTSPGGKLIALAGHPTKKVIKAEAEFLVMCEPSRNEL